MIIALVAVSAAFVFALGVAVHEHHALYRLKCAQLEMVSNALGNSVLVDGIELPKPDDSRWMFAEALAVDGAKQFVLHINGTVRVMDTGGIYIGGGVTCTRAEITPATKKYCSAVWKEYRSRVARKAIETSA